MLKWKFTAPQFLDDFSEWAVAYRNCSLRILHADRVYNVFVERHCVICTATFRGRGALHRAKLAAPKLANVMIQHSATHHESNRRAK